jgi:nicotinamide riboside kinase
MGEANASVARIAEAMPPRALYLLTSDEDVPFTDDGLRDGEHLRAWMTERFREKLSAQRVPWLELRGSPTERLAAALAAVDEALDSAWRFALPLEQRSS